MTSQTKSTNIIDHLIARLDHIQRKHKRFGFPYAVVKKYGDDNANYLAALLAYFGFLALFPLLIVATAVIQRVSFGNTDLQEQLITSITSYFPALGDGIANSIRTTGRTGIVLVIGLVIMFYGARGVADAAQYALNHAWMVGRKQRSGFPLSMIRSFCMIVGGGLGFMVAALVSGFATANGHNFLVRLLLGLLGFLLLYSVFWAIFTFGSSAKHSLRATVDGALFATLGLLALQLLGGYIINHQLSTQTGLNAQLAFVLAILFWLYLQARIFLYAIEINTVRYYGLWPRSIDANNPTEGDKKAYSLYAQRDSFELEQIVNPK